MTNNNVNDSETVMNQVPVLFERLQNRGVEFFIDGEPVFWRKAVETAVKEESTYMTDYVMEEEGRIKQVRLDKVSLP